MSRQQLRAVTDDDLLRFNPFEGDKDDAGVRLQRKSVVRTRKPQECRMGEPHPMPVGTRAVHYRGILDGKWRGFYLCAECIRKVLEEFPA